MAYNRNGGNGRVVDFKDGQPVFKRGRNTRGQVKGGRADDERSANSRGGYRGGADRRNGGAAPAREGGAGRYGKENDGGAERTYRRYEGGRYEGAEGGRGPAKSGTGYRRSTDIDPHRHDRGRGELAPGRSYGSGGSRMEDFPHDERPRREREGYEDPRAAYREGRRETGRTARFGLKPAMPEDEERTEELPNIIMGRNPVKEAIKAGRSIDRILVSSEHDGSLNEILDLARDAKLVVRNVDRSKLDEICMPFGHNGRPGNHQGIIAYIPGVEYCELDDILDRAKEKGEAPFIILLDGIEDPHNLGSIIRSAECAGAHGVVITKRRSASVTAAVVKTSAGATEHMPIAKVVNLSVAIERLKEAGVWVAGADMGGEPLYSANLKGPFALVVGAEGAGISRLVAEKCDYLVSIPLMGQMESLNASVAAAIIMFEKVRQDKAK